MEFGNFEFARSAGGRDWNIGIWNFAWNFGADTKQRNKILIIRYSYAYVRNKLAFECFFALDAPRQTREDAGRTRDAS